MYRLRWHNNQYNIKLLFQIIFHYASRALNTVPLLSCLSLSSDGDSLPEPAFSLDDMCTELLAEYDHSPPSVGGPLPFLGQLMVAVAVLDETPSEEQRGSGDQHSDQITGIAVTGRIPDLV